MSAIFARPLHDNELTSVFLKKVLGYRDCPETGDLAIKVTKAELLLDTMISRDTLKGASYRHPSYSKDESRVSLRQEIFEELIAMGRPGSDDEVAKGIGGIAPPEGVDICADKQAFILIGLPASGKSSVSNRIADKYGAFIVDSDFAKRKFPEFKDEYGAALVHEESTLVTFGSEDKAFSEEPNVIGFCTAQGINMVIPKIGAKAESIRNLRNTLIEKGYSVHLTLVKADRLCATKRALTRFEKTSRYVPISLIFDGYSNDPILTYYYTRADKEWTSTGCICTESNPTIKIESTDNNPAELYS